MYPPNSVQVSIHFLREGLRATAVPDLDPGSASKISASYEKPLVRDRSESIRRGWRPGQELSVWCPNSSVRKGGRRADHPRQCERRSLSASRPSTMAMEAADTRAVAANSSGA